MKWNALNHYSRLLDCGNGPWSDNIYVANVDKTTTIRAAFYRGNGSVGTTTRPSTRRWPCTPTRGSTWW